MIDGNRNISNGVIAQSVKFSRLLRTQEQFDISVISDLRLLDGVDYLHGVDPSVSCTNFVRSFTSADNVIECINVPKFTCHRVWVNNGIS